MTSGSGFAPHARSTTVGIMWGDGDIVVAADDAFLAIVGFTREELEAGQFNWRTQTPPEFLHLDDAGIRQASSSGGFTAPYEKQFFRKDGTRVPVLLVCAMVPDQPGRWMGYCVDLSPDSISRQQVPTSLPAEPVAPVPDEFYRRLVAQLVNDRARASAMLDSTDSPVWAVDVNRRLIGANQAFQIAQRRVSGIDLEIGAGLMGPEFPEQLRRQWDDWYARAFAGERFTAFTELDRDGSIYRHDHVLTPMRDGAGVIYGVTVVSHDVSERYATEEALRRSETRFRTLAAGSPLGIYLCDLNGDVIYSNTRMQQIWALSEAEMLGLQTTTRLHPEDATRVMSTFFDAVSAQRDVFLEFRLLLPGGVVRHVRTWISCLSEDGRVTGYIGSVEDATEWRELAQTTRQRERLESLGTLAGGIAHDFNNMLGIVLGYTELGLTAPQLPPLLRNDLTEIRTASLRARDLVRQILTFSRHTDGDHTAVDLTALTRESGRLLRATMPAHVALTVTAPESPITINGNASALQQVIVNLCVNAEHATRDVDDARVAIALDIEDGGGVAVARLTVTDNGHGMTTEVADRVFEPFFTTRQQGGGTGMGLAVVHGTVLAHGGAIRLDTAPGRGTTFSITLPTCTAGSDPTVTTSLPQRGSERVLLVEDEAQLANALSRALTQSGYQVTHCTTAIEALRMLSAGVCTPDVVLSDVAMPGLTGDRMARDLEILHPALPVVLMTGFSEDVQPDGPRGQNVRAILQKPLSLTQLESALREALA